MYISDFEASMLQQNIEKLEKGFRENILFDKSNRLKQTIFNSISINFFAKDGFLLACDGNSNYMPISEIKELISYLEYTVENFNEDESIKEELEYKRIKLSNRISELKKPKEIKAKTGEVYLIKGENNRYKIGCSKNATNRTKSLRLSSCENHKLIHSFKTFNPFKKERELHDKFKDKRSHSEWFELCIDDVNFIKGIKDEY